MIDVHFVILGALCTAVGSASYVVQTVRGRTQPNRVTWFRWAVAPLLAFAVEIQYGVGLRSLMTFMVGASPLAVFLASFVNRSAVWRVGPFDYLCGALSAAGTIGWLVTRTGLVALAASIAADLVAGIPTLVKAWRQPETEAPGAYIGATLNAGITLLTVRRVTAAEVAFPFYILVIGLVLVVLVAGRLGPRVRGEVASGGERGGEGKARDQEEGRRAGRGRRADRSDGRALHLASRFTLFRKTR